MEGGGKDVRDTLLASKDSAEMYAGRLTELAVALGFDGWLVLLCLWCFHRMVHMNPIAY